MTALYPLEAFAGPKLAGYSFGSIAPIRGYCKT